MCVCVCVDEKGKPLVNPGQGETHGTWKTFPDDGVFAARFLFGKGWFFKL